METKPKYTRKSWIEVKGAVRFIDDAVARRGLSAYLPNAYTLLMENRRTTRRGNRDKYGEIPCFKIKGTNRIVYQIALLWEWVNTRLIPALENDKQRRQDEAKVAAAIKASKLSRKIKKSAPKAHVIVTAVKHSMAGVITA
jgi:hypothetical protein